MNAPIPAPEPRAPAHAAGASRTGATGPPGDDTGPPAFASVLDSQVARTALAEGQKNTGQSSDASRDGRGQDPTETTPPTATSDAVAAILGALQAAAGALSRISPLGGGSVSGSATTAAPAGTDQPGSATPQALPGAPAATAGAPVSATSATISATTVEAALATPDPQAGAGDASATTGGQTAASGQVAPSTAANPGSTAAAGAPALEISPGTGNSPLATPAPQGGSPTTAAPPVDGAAVTPGPLPTAPQQPAGATPAPQPSGPTAPQPTPATAPQAPVTSQAPATPQAPPAVSHATVATPTPDAPSTSATPSALHAANAAVQPDTGSAQPNPSTDPSTPVSLQNVTLPSTAAAPASTGAAAQGAGVGLAHAIETVRMTIEMAANRGYSQARIELSPPELGSIRIHLHQTADGLVARVVAEHAAAAQTLEQGGGDLRRSLEQAGLPLLRLDIEASGQQGAQPRDPQFAPSAAPRDSSSPDEPAEPETSDAGTIAQLSLPGGAVVDILA